jgi:ABC-2 type transport system ATP-binding protein
MAVLSVECARKRYGSVQALDGVSMELNEGELLALLGPNGAGKTTLIRAISGRAALDAGEIRVFGERVRPGTTSKALGIVPQEVAVYPSLTARENLSTFGALHGLSGRALAERIDWALAHTALADRADEPVRRFSGGMRRRLNIGCALLHQPRIVLLDEPTVGVDPQSRDRIYDMLADLAAGGASLLLTTHHLEEAEARCSRTVIIDHGRTIASGTLAQLVDGTVGRHRLVTLRVEPPVGPTGDSLSGIDVDAVDRRFVRARMDNVAEELPPLLDRIRTSGRTIEDVDVRGPSLQAVFIHLTGRELRE